MFIRLAKTLGMIALATAAVACGSDPGTGSSQENVGGSFDPISLPANEIDMIVDLVNSPATTLDVLDREVDLDVRAAQNIIAHRNGPDGVYPSADDNRFDNLEELDGVPFVGDSALRKLHEYAIANPPAQAEFVDGVQFTAEQATAVVWGVNHASLPELDEEVGLLSGAAENLIANAPYETVTQIGAISGVGPAALTALRNHAVIWGAEMSQGTTSQAGTYDGIDFDSQTAEIALSIANTATYAQLTGEAGLYSGGANAIISGRPFATLAEVSDSYGIGEATMSALHDYAASGKFAPAGMAGQQQ